MGQVKSMRRRLAMLCAAALLYVGAGLSRPVRVAAGLSRPILAQRGQAPALVLSQLAWFNRTGRQLSTVGPLADYGNVELSPDGTRVGVAIGELATGTRDIWIYEPSGQRTRVTSDAADENWMVWSRDGQNIAMNAFARQQLALFQSPVRDDAMRTLLLDDADGKWPVSWSPDGQHLLYVANRQATGNDIRVLPLFGDRRSFAFAATAAAENWAAFSPDGRWVVYSSTEATGSAEVYVATFPRTGQSVRVSVDGGSQARWRRNGEILYLDPNRRLMAAAIRITGDAVAVTGVDPLFTLNLPFGAYHAFDVTPDGQRILVNTAIVAPNTPSLTVFNRSSANPSGSRGEP